MLNKIIPILLLAGVMSMARADTVQINPDHPDRYVVVKGDTLWDIAERFLTQPWRWPEIWKVNPQIENPHLIYPGDVVSLTYEGGSPILTVERGGSAGKRGAARMVKLSPEIREVDTAEAVPSIPIDVIRNFLSRPMVINDDQEMDALPYIVSSYDQHLVAGEGDRVYIKGLSQEAGQRTYSIYRKGPAYKKNDRVIGYEALYVGEAVIEKHGDPSTATITQSSREVLNGDRLMPQSDKDINRDFTPRSPGNPVSGHIISVVDGLLEIGQYQIVVVDLGESDGMEAGTVLGIYQSGKVVTDTTGAKSNWPLANTPLGEYLGTPKARGVDVKLPEEYAGVVMIFRIYDRVSYGIVMQAYGPLKINDSVKNL
jgi:hypothetical protein